MKIAIIGTGISGLTSGYYLSQQHDVSVFEANDYIGGHTATIDFEYQGKQQRVDTGFIVFNDRTYPNFIQLMDRLGVKGVPTEMSFSVRNDNNGLEYNGHQVSTLFAQKRNWFNPRFYRFIFEILRFNKLAKQFARDNEVEWQTLGEFLSDNQFSEYFCENYILPMGAAIWSSTLADMRSFPLNFFLRFFLNHGLLEIKNRPQWYVVEGGSNAYIEPLIQGFKENIHLNSPVTAVKREAGAVRLQVNGEWQTFDQVVFSCHSDQALAILGDDATELEQQILGDMQYQANEVVLHADTALLPKRTKAWAAWNYHLKADGHSEHSLPTLTYDMNILQHIQSEHTFCVSLNNSSMIDPQKIIGQYVYHHPVFTVASIAAQQRKQEINGANNTWFCGAYWRNGFHEDGVVSALDVVYAMDKVSPKKLQGAA
jgi:predicted NAD/FAD-binding protein